MYENNSKMKRKEFINALSGGLAATCVSCLVAACSKDDSGGGNITPNPGGGAVGTNSVTVNLDSELKSVNDFVAKSGVIVIRKASGNTPASFLALSSVCPHAGATVEYNNGLSTFYCAAHGSAFAADGAVTQGPATKGLTKLNVEVTGATLSVKV